MPGPLINTPNKLWYKLGTLRDRIQFGQEATAMLDDYESGRFELFSEEEYKSEEFKDVLVRLLSRAGMGGSYTPKELNEFINELLLPGQTLSLFSRAGLLMQGSDFTGIEEHEELRKYNRLLTLSDDTRPTLIAHAPATWQGESQFENVVVIPPFGQKGDFDFQLAKSINVNASNQVILVLPEAILHGERNAKLREHYFENFSLESVVSLPVSSFSPYTGIKTSVIILRKTQAKGRTLFIEVEDLSELGHASKAIQDSRFDRRPKLGFFGEVDAGERWDYKYHEPLDNTEELKNLPYAIKVKKLQEISSYTLGKREESSHVAINKTGSNVKKADDPSVNEKNTIFLTFDESIDPEYIIAYLSSELGTKALSKVVKGSTIPYISTKDIGLMEVAVPEIEVQSNIASAHKEMEALSEKLMSVIENTKMAFKTNPFKYETLNENLLGISTKAEESYSQLLPFPIAIVNRKLENAQTYKEKCTILVELFESLVKYTALINVSDYLTRLKLGDEPGMGIERLQRPALGDWVNIFFALANLKNQPQAEPFISELKDVRLGKYSSSFQKVLQDRNDLLGHGAAMPDHEYRRHFDELRPIITDTINLLGFFYKYRLVKPITLTYNDDSFKVDYYDLMGDNSLFSINSKQTTNPIKTDAVLLMKEDGSYLNLDPFIILEECQTCRRLELLFFDKFDKNGVTYLSFETGHKSTLQNLDKLPQALRDTLRT